MEWHRYPGYKFLLSTKHVAVAAEKVVAVVELMVREVGGVEGAKE
jgi:hypothetical protein